MYVRIFENRLEIYNLRPEDAGIYECYTDDSNSKKFDLIIRPARNDLVDSPEVDVPTDIYTQEERRTTPRYDDEYTRNEQTDSPEVDVTTDIYTQEERRTTPRYVDEYTRNEQTDNAVVDSYVIKNVNTMVELVCPLKVSNYDEIDWKKLDGVLFFYLKN
jgi:hypothetical protein